MNEKGQCFSGAKKTIWSLHVGLGGWNAERAPHYGPPCYSLALSPVWLPHAAPLQTRLTSTNEINADNPPNLGCHCSALNMLLVVDSTTTPATSPCKCQHKTHGCSGRAAAGGACSRLGRRKRLILEQKGGKQRKEAGRKAGAKATRHPWPF